MSDDDLTGAAATRAVKSALDAAEIGPGDYEVHSRKEEDGAVSEVAVSGWAPAELVQLVAAALKNVEGNPKVRQDGNLFTLQF